MLKIVKTTRTVADNGLLLIKSYYNNGIVKTYVRIGNHIKFIDEATYIPKDLKN